MDCRVGDDWLVDSLIRYENIWMYGLQDSSKCLSWMSDKGKSGRISVCLWVFLKITGVPALSRF